MDKLKEELLRQAVELHGEIAPPCSCGSLAESFTVEDSRLIFWFNDKSGNTRVLVREHRARFYARRSEPPERPASPPIGAATSRTARGSRHSRA